MTRESVAEAALAIADRHGFEAVTIRAVAVAVGATPMALYTYFRDKDALYGGMRERIFANVIVSIRSGGKWQTMLETCGQAVFRVMREHPNWTPLLAHPGEPPPAALGFLDGLLASMSKDGLTIEDGIRVYAGVMSFAFGSVLFERLLLGSGDGVSRRLTILKELVARSPAKLNTLSAAAAKMNEGWTFEEVFNRGLVSLIRGVGTRGAGKRATSTR